MPTNIVVSQNIDIKSMAMACRARKCWTLLSWVRSLFSNNLQSTHQHLKDPEGIFVQFGATGKVSKCYSECAKEVCTSNIFSADCNQVTNNPASARRSAMRCRRDTLSLGGSGGSSTSGASRSIALYYLH